MMRHRDLVRARWARMLVPFLGLGAAAAPARAQFPVAAGPPIVMVAPTVASSGGYVDPVTASSLGSRGVTYATPPFSQARRKSRTANRYTVARPVYAGRPGVSFGGYSDYYFPRVIGARETVYTAAPEAPVPVGYRAFVRPGTPVFPR